MATGQDARQVGFRRRQGGLALHHAQVEPGTVEFGHRLTFLDRAANVGVELLDNTGDA